MSTSLLKLYSSVLVAILSEWIEIEELCCLDTAVSTSVRPQLLKLMTFCRTDLDHWCVHFQEKIAWVYLRGLKVNSVMLRSNFNSKLVSVMANTVQYLETSADRELSEIIRSTGISIVSLKLYSFAYCCDFGSVLVQLPSLLRLDLSGCHSLCPYFSKKMCSYCPQLIEFTAPRNQDILPVLELCSLRVIKNVDIKFLFPLGKSHSSCDLLLSTDDEMESSILVCSRPFRLTGLALHQQATEEELRFLNPHLHSVESLVLGKTLSKVWLQALALRCSKLTSFVVSHGCTIRKVAMVNIIKMAPLLKIIDLCHCYNMTNYVLVTIANCCPQLEQLHVSDFNFSNDVLRAVGKQCTKLVKFVGSIGLGAMLYDAVVDQQSISIVRQHKNNFWTKQVLYRLRSFSCFSRVSCDIDVLKMVCVQNASTLVQLNFVLQLITFDFLDEILCRCPLLTSIGVLNCPTISCAKVFKCVSHCQRLTYMSYRALESFDPCSVIEFLMGKPYLTKLNLTVCVGEFTNIFLVIAKYCPYITHIDVSHSRNILTSDVVTLLSGKCKLDYLNLEGCHAVAAAFLSKLPLRMRYLNVRQCNFSKKELQDFLKSSGFQCTSALVF